jgi:hypothetical protein
MSLDRRIPTINPKLRSDHRPNCWSLALAGGGINSGQVVARADDHGYNVAERVVTMGDLYATIYHALAIDWKKEYMSPIGRPVKISNSPDDRTGTPVKELLGRLRGWSACNASGCCLTCKCGRLEWTSREHFPQRW